MGNESYDSFWSGRCGAVAGAVFALLIVGCGVGCGAEQEREQPSDPPGDTEGGDPGAEEDPPGDETCAAIALERLVGGFQHVCGIDGAGDVFCWGDPNHDRLGGQVETGVAPRPVALPEAAIDLALGHAHTCALLQGGAVSCWGKNDVGQLGRGYADGEFGAPGTVHGVSDAVAIGGSAHTTCAVDSAGDVSCWGNTHDGQLGVKDATSGISALELQFPEAIAGIARGGDSHLCAWSESGSVYCWGQNVFGEADPAAETGAALAEPVQVAGLAGATSVVTASEHTCALLEDGSVSCFGLGHSGRLGTGEWLPDAFYAPLPTTDLSGVVDLASGGHHTCARRDDGTVLCWGPSSTGANGELNLGDRHTPTQVPSVSDAAAIAATFEGTCALDSAGELTCWGMARHAEDLSGAHIGQPVALGVAASPAQVELGERSGCVLTESGSLRCWGSNKFGAVGIDSTSGIIDEPVEVLSAVDQVDVGPTHACATKGEELFCWGSNWSAQLATDGGQIAVPTHTQLLGATVDLALGANHGCAVVDQGVLCWGGNQYAQSGASAGSLASPLPTLIVDSESAVQVEAGGSHSCLRRESGEVACWGAGGRIGRQDWTPSPSAVSVVGLGETRDIATASNTSCALEAGRVYCWGNGNSGELGRVPSGSWKWSLVPVLVPDLDDVVDIEAGWHHFCGLRSGGEVWCWGDASTGAVAAETQRYVGPTRVDLPGKAIHVSASLNATCAVLEGGETYCWGNNGYGLLLSAIDLDAPQATAVSPAVCLQD